jgi:hypothetical protein
MIKHTSYECLIDKDNYSIINFVDTNDDTDSHIALGNVKTFMLNLQNSFRNKALLKRQIAVDFPREICLINNIQVKNYQHFIKEFKNTYLLNDAKLICTQSVFYPIFLDLSKKFANDVENIYLSDYGNCSNPITLNFKIFNKNHMIVDIQKNFRIIKLIDGDPILIKMLKIKMRIEIDIVDHTVYYIIE